MESANADEPQTEPDEPSKSRPRRTSPSPPPGDPGSTSDETLCLSDEFSSHDFFSDVESFKDLGRRLQATRAGPGHDVPRHLGPFQIEESIGRGLTGTVFRARHDRTGRRVALKVTPSNNLDRADELRAEGRKLGSIDHPNVVKVLDTGEEKGHVWQALDLVPGTTLARRIVEAQNRAASTDDGLGRARTKPEPLIPPDLAVDWFTDAARGLAALHKAGLIHRDVKPGNIMISEHGPAVLIDLGLAVSADTLDMLDDAIAGTIPYMSPEQLAGGAGSLTPRSDVYSLGATFFEVLTGRRLVTSVLRSGVGGGYQVTRAVKPGDLIPGIPAEISRIIDTCIDADPARRFENGAALAESLEETRAALSSALRPRPPVITRTRTIVATTCLLLLAALGAGLWKRNVRGREIQIVIDRAAGALATRGPSASLGELMSARRSLGPSERLDAAIGDLTRREAPAILGEWTAALTIMRGDPAALADFDAAARDAEEALEVSPVPDLLGLAVLRGVLTRDGRVAATLAAHPTIDCATVADLDAIVRLETHDIAGFADSVARADRLRASGDDGNRSILVWRDYCWRRAFDRAANRGSTGEAAAPWPQALSARTPELSAIRAALRKLTESSPGNALARTVLGLAAWDDGDFVEAHRAFDGVWRERGARPSTAHLIAVAAIARWFTAAATNGATEPVLDGVVSDLDRAASESPLSWRTAFTFAGDAVKRTHGRAAGVALCRKLAPRWTKRDETPSGLFRTLAECALQARDATDTPSSLRASELESTWAVVSEHDMAHRSTDDRFHRHLILECCVATLGDTARATTDAAVAIELGGRIEALIEHEITRNGDAGYDAQWEALQGIARVADVASSKLPASVARLGITIGCRLTDDAYFASELERTPYAAVRSRRPERRGEAARHLEALRALEF